MKRFPAPGTIGNVTLKRVTFAGDAAFCLCTVQHYRERGRVVLMDRLIVTSRERGYQAMNKGTMR